MDHLDGRIRAFGSRCLLDDRLEPGISTKRGQIGIGDRSGRFGAVFEGTAKEVESLIAGANVGGGSGRERGDTGRVVESLARGRLTVEAPVDILPGVLPVAFPGQEHSA